MEKKTEMRESVQQTAQQMDDLQKKIQETENVTNPVQQTAQQIDDLQKKIQETENVTNPVQQTTQQMDDLQKKIQETANVANPLQQMNNPWQQAAQQMAQQMNNPWQQTAQQMAQQMNNPWQQAAQQIGQQIGQRMTEMYDNINNQMQSMIEAMNNAIDWDLVSEAVARQIKEVEEILVEQEEDFWCLDTDIVEAIVDGEVARDKLSEYVDKNLESYITEIIQDPIYELHATLIKETYEAYKAGFYKLCIMPIFAAFEHVFTLWYMGKIKTDMISVKHKPNVRKLYHNIKPDVYNDTERERFNVVFVQSVLRTYKNLFAKIPEELCQDLNRNSIAHGYHDYGSLTQTDVLKLFQLLKSTLILKSFNSK